MEQQDSLQKLNEPIFTRKKTLLTVGQYAAKQGISTGIVHECTRFGVVQVRKHKNKTFIVDLPLDTYKIIRQQDSLSSDEAVDSTLYANKITDLVNKIFKPDNDTKVLPAAAKKNTDRKESVAPAGRSRGVEIKLVPAEMPSSQPQHKKPDAIPDLHLFAEEENRTANNKNELQAGGFRVPPMRSFTDSLRAVSIWKMSFIIAAAAFAISLCAYAWVSIERKNQHQKLQQAYDSIGRLMTKYEETRQQARMYEFDMMSWRSEAEQAKKAMLNSETELRDTRRSLAETKKDLQNMQLYNNDKLKELNEQVTKIRSHIPNAGEQPAQ